MAESVARPGLHISVAVQQCMRETGVSSTTRVSVLHASLEGHVGIQIVATSVCALQRILEPFVKPTWHAVGIRVRMVDSV